MSLTQKKHGFVVNKYKNDHFINISILAWQFKPNVEEKPVGDIVIPGWDVLRLYSWLYVNIAYAMAVTSLVYENKKLTTQYISSLTQASEDNNQQVMQQHYVSWEIHNLNASQKTRNLWFSHINVIICVEENFQALIISSWISLV